MPALSGPGQLLCPVQQPQCPCTPISIWTRSSGLEHPPASSPVWLLQSSPCSYSFPQTDLIKPLTTPVHQLSRLSAIGCTLAWLSPSQFQLWPHKPSSLNKEVFLSFQVFADVSFTRQCPPHRHPLFQSPTSIPFSFVGPTENVTEYRKPSGQSLLLGLSNWVHWSSISIRYVLFPADCEIPRKSHLGISRALLRVLHTKGICRPTQSPPQKNNKNKTTFKSQNQY